jgi:lipoate-protein ligase A
MRVLDLTLAAATENLALDEALLLEAEAGRGSEILRLWEWSQNVVVLGSGGCLHEDVDEAACAAEGIPILRRASGGGTVLLGGGCLCFCLVLAYNRSPALREIPFSYLLILDKIRQALHDLLPAIEFAGTSDLMAAGRKFSGNAQQRKRTFFLHHGTLLFDFDLTRIRRFLRMPGRQPAYRGGRDHEDFLCNLPTTGEELRRRLRCVWEATEETTDWPQDQVAILVAEKYSRPEWVRRR